MSYTKERIAERLRESEIAGGEGYEPADDRVRPEDADVVATSPESLYQACGSPGQTVFVDETIFLDAPLQLAADVTLAGGRGLEDRGGQLITDQQGDGSAAEKGIIRSHKDGVRVTGLRLRGPAVKSDWIPPSDLNEHLSIGLRLYGDSRVDNCEIYGFPYAGIRIGSRSANPEVEVDHSYLHTFRQDGLGYCIDVVNGHTHIHHNWLDDARHHICGFGFASCSYTLEDSILGPSTLLHSVDMHCLGENFPDGSQFVTEDRDADGDPWYFYRAGGEVIVRRCTFAFRNYVSGGPGVCIAIRGEPRDRVWIDANRFMHPGPPDENSGNSSRGNCWRQVNVGDWTNVPTNDRGWTANFTAGDNQFGAPEAPWSPDYGAPIHIAGPKASQNQIDRQQALEISQSLREVKEPLDELRAILQNS